METQTVTLRKVCRRVVSRSILFEKNSGELLDRLDDLTFLIHLRTAEPELARGIQQTIMSGLETLKDLSLYLKEYILSRDIDHPEFNLLKKVFKRQRKIAKLCDFPYVIGYEWAHHQFNAETEMMEIHRGDLAFMDEAGNFLVVELKCIQLEQDFEHPDRRAKRLKLVREQTDKFRSMFQHRFPWAHVEGLALTNLVSYLSGENKPLQQIKGIL